MNKYIFIDIDGTLFSTVINGVPNSALEAIKLARNNGHKVYLCTGRALPECKVYLNLDVDGFIFSAGSIVYSNTKKIYEKPFDIEFIDKVMNTSDKLNVGYVIGGNAGAYANDIGYKEITKYFAKNENDPIKIREILMNNGVFDIKDKHPLDYINKICIYANSLDDIKQLENILGDSIYFALSHNDGEHYFGDIIRKDINKFTGIQEVLKVENVDIENTMCIGDSNNDIDMLKGCHIGIAMGNAYENVKEYADYVTDDILEDGIYNAFKKYNLI